MWGIIIIIIIIITIIKYHIHQQIDVFLNFITGTVDTKANAIVWGIRDIRYAVCCVCCVYAVLCMLCCVCCVFCMPV